MAFRIRYRPLCTVSIHHGYHLNKGLTAFDDLPASEQQRKLAGYDAFADLRLAVPKDTRHRLDGLGALVRQTAEGFVVGIAADEVAGGAFVPERLPQDGFTLRFSLRARELGFFGYTNVDVAQEARSVYYVSNRVGASSGGAFPFLATPPPDYDAGVEYAPGDLVRPVGSTTERFVAARGGILAAPPGDGWIALGARNYLHDADRMPLHGARFLYEFSVLGAMLAAFELRAADGTVFDLGEQQALAGAVMQSATVDASRVPSGQYLLTVVGLDGFSQVFSESGPVYIDAELARTEPFAVIEIVHQPGAPLGDYRLFDETADFALREPQFRLQLLNRHTFWRYQFAEPPGTPTTDDDVEPLGDRFVTKEAKPLTRGVERVEFGTRLLPNPTGGLVIPEPDRIYSDVFVHTNP